MSHHEGVRESRRTRWSRSKRRHPHDQPLPPAIRPVISKPSSPLIPLPPLPAHPPETPRYTPLSYYFRRQRHFHLSLTFTLEEEPDPIAVVPSRPLLNPIPIGDLRNHECRTIPPWDATRHPLPTFEVPVIPLRQPNSTFHLFQRFPPEIRAYVWKQYCPELGQSSRIYSIPLYNAPDRAGHRHFRFRDELELSNMTHALRMVMKIHQESRALACGIVPDSFTITYSIYSKIDAHNKHGIVRYNRQTDILHLTNASVLITTLHPRRLPADNLEYVQNVALDIPAVITKEQKTRYMEILGAFSNIKKVYICQTSTQTSPRSFRWVTAPNVRSQFVEISSKATPTIFCWPKEDINTPDELMGSMGELRPHVEKQGWQLLPMAQFLARFGWHQYELFQSTKDMNDSEFDDHYKEFDDNYQSSPVAF